MRLFRPSGGAHLGLLAVMLRVVLAQILLGDSVHRCPLRATAAGEDAGPADHPVRGADDARALSPVSYVGLDPD